MLEILKCEDGLENCHRSDKCYRATMSDAAGVMEFHEQYHKKGKCPVFISHPDGRKMAREAKVKQKEQKSAVEKLRSAMGRK